MERDQIHSQLLGDCHHLGSLAASELLLNRNAALPWFIIVPDTRINDVLDLPEHLRDEVMAECAGVSTFIKQGLGFEKVNFAALGNIVPQMHLHIIGRREGDPCWPQPVWGNLAVNEAYEPARLLNWQNDLIQMIDLLPADLSI